MLATQVHVGLGFCRVECVFLAVRLYFGPVSRLISQVLDRVLGQPVYQLDSVGSTSLIWGVLHICFELLC